MAMSKAGGPLETLAGDLARAWKAHQAVDPAAYAGRIGTFDEAYAVQAAFASMKGEKTGGWKISLTSAASQKLFGISEPLFGEEAVSQILASPATVALSRMNEPKLEAEIVFRAKEALEPELSDEALLARTLVSGGIEIPDSRFLHWFPSIEKHLFVADGAIGGAIVVGSDAVDGASLAPADLARVHVDVRRGGELAAAGDSTEVLGNPIAALRWLVDSLAKRGRRVEAGEVVSSGTFVNPMPLAPGRWEAVFTGAVSSTAALDAVD